MKFCIGSIFPKNLSRKRIAATVHESPPPMGRTTCTEPQCLYKGALYLYLHEFQCMVLVISRWIHRVMRNVSDKNCRENQNILCSITPPPRKPSRLLDNVQKYCRDRQVTVDNKAHAHCMLDNEGYKHTFRICNT